MEPMRDPTFVGFFRQPPDPTGMAILAGLVSPAGS